MRKQPYPITDLTGGIKVDIDPLYISDKNSPDIQNCRFEKGLVKKDLGYRTFGTKVLGVPLLQKTYTQTDGDKFLLLFTTTSVYLYSSTYLDWLDISTATDVTACSSVWAFSGGEIIFAAEGAVLFESNTDVEWCTASTEVVLSPGKFQTNSVKVKIYTPFSTGVTAYFELDPAVDLSSCTHIHLLVKANEDTTAGEFQLNLCSDTIGEVITEALDLPALTADTWTRVSLTLGTPAGLDAVASVSLSRTADNGAIEYHLEGIIGVTEYTGTVDDLWSATVINDICVFTNYVDPMQTFSGTVVAELAGAPRAKYITAFQNRIVAAGVLVTGTARPYRVMWSSAGTYDTWSGGTSGYVDLVDTFDWCTAIELLADKCFVYKERSVWELVYVGGTQVFIPKMRQSLNGTRASRSIQTIKDKHIFWSSDAIYAFDGVYTAPLDADISPLLYSSTERIASLTYPKRACSVYIEEIGEYWLALPTVTEPSYSNTIFKRSKTGGFTRSPGVSVSCFGTWEYTKTIVTWTAASGTWSSNNYGTWGRQGLPGAAPTILIGWTDGQIYEDDRSTGSSESMTFVTKDFIFSRAQRWIEVRILYRYGPVNLYYSTDGSTTWTSLGQLKHVSDWTEGVKYFNITSQKVRFKLTTSALEFDLKWLEPWYIPKARSKDLNMV